MYRIGSIAPLLLGIACLFYSYSLSLGLLITERSEDYERFTGKTWLVVAGALSTGVFIYLFQWFGFIVPAFLTLVFWLRYLGKESWKMGFGLAALVTAVFYVLFAIILGIPLPESVLL